MVWVCLCIGKFCTSIDVVCVDSPAMRLGLEGLVMFKHDVEFDAENYTVTIPSSAGKKEQANGAAISVFDKVVVNITVEKDQNTQRGKVKMTLVSPASSE